MSSLKYNTVIRVMALIIMLAATPVLKAQSNIPSLNKIIDYTKKNEEAISEYIHKAEEAINSKLHKAESLISNKLDQRDSLYVIPNEYDMTVMTQYSYTYEYYRFTSSDNSQSIALRPDNGNKIGLYVGWKWLFLGWYFDMTKNDAKRDINLSFYTAKLGIDLLFRKRDKGFEISNTRGVVNEYGLKLTDYNPSHNGFSTKQKGINIYYIFNNKRFSYPAAYSQSNTQRISAGSFILGLTYNEQKFSFNYLNMDPRLTLSLKDDLIFNKVKYKDFSIKFGYSYNWVFAKNWLANLSLTPCIGYKNSSLKLFYSKELISSINFDLISRASVVYNNGDYYISASFISHTYSYRKSELSVINGFGNINLSIGYNFWKKKPKN